MHNTAALVFGPTLLSDGCRNNCARAHCMTKSTMSTIDQDRFEPRQLSPHPLVLFMASKSKIDFCNVTVRVFHCLGITNDSGCRPGEELCSISTNFTAAASSVSLLMWIWTLHLVSQGGRNTPRLMTRLLIVAGRGL